MTVLRSSGDEPVENEAAPAITDHDQNDRVPPETDGAVPQPRDNRDVRFLEWVEGITSKDAPRTISPLSVTTLLAAVVPRLGAELLPPSAARSS